MRFSRSTHLLMFLFLLTLTSIIRTGLPLLVELIYLVNSVISNDLTQIVNLPTQIPDSDSNGPALLDLFLTSCASICSTMEFLFITKFWSCCCLSFHWLSIDFPNCQWDAPFHCIAYDYCRADFDGLRDHLRDVPWEDSFKFGASAAAASEFY